MDAAPGTTIPADPRPPVTFEDVLAARERIRPYVRRTPLFRAPRIPGMPDGPVYLKLESLQATGSFKLRGATNRIRQLSEADRRRGVIAASGGNHAQGVAEAARSMGVSATVVMPSNASEVKAERARALGAEVVRAGLDYEEAHEEAIRRQRRTGRVMIEPFDDPAIIAGQGTVGLEIVEDLPDVGSILAGVGGGGLLAGIAVGAHGLSHRTAIVGVQAAGADTLGRSLSEGRIVVGPPPRTIADGLATRRIGALPFDLFRAHGVRSTVVGEADLARATLSLLEDAKVVAEPAAAAPLAAWLRSADLHLTGPVVLVVSGGNLDLSKVETLRRLAREGDGGAPDAPRTG
ncbi:MAG TPA: threonine/serine dehydratase [Thermoplasmata archaeon]|nr:threonine/serine dehydratase [Thermoplasmata archaeon]